MFSRPIRRVAMMCPTVITGGPEAIHQFAFIANSLGVRCDLVYYGSENRVSVSPTQIACDRPTSPGMMAFYEVYAPLVRPEIPLDEETLVILPEGVALSCRHFTRNPVAIWWLSVDNAFRGQPELEDSDVLRDCLTRPGVLHMYQSVYAREFLRANGATNLLELGDYTADIYTRHFPQGPPPEPRCTYNAAKGADLAEAFFGPRPELDAIALRRFTKPQLKELFQKRLIYVDFGHFPGRDRLPREAAASGGLVFVRRQGSGALYDDFPLPDHFKFTPEEIENGSLAERLAAVFADPEPFWRQQQPFRMGIAWEKKVFEQQVMRLLGMRPPL